MKQSEPMNATFWDMVYTVAKPSHSHVYIHLANHKHNEPIRTRRKNLPPLPSAGKCATGAKRGKMRHQCQARENAPPVPSAGKCATGTKRGKMRARQQNVDFCFDCSVWLEKCAQQNQNNYVLPF